MRTSPRIVLPALLLALAAVAAGCSGLGGQKDDALVVYAGRNENLIRPLLDRFAKERDVDISVKYADTSELLPTIREEGDRTRADVFIAQDAGALSELSRLGMLAALPADVTKRVDERFRDPEGRWVALTGRVRVFAYNTDALDADDVPDSVVDLVDPRWKDKIGYPPTNASFVSWVSALRQQLGEEQTRAFLEGLERNGAKRYTNNIQTLQALADGEIELGLVNHYYLYNEFKEQPDAPVANHYPGQDPGGEGTFVNVSGIGILEGSDKPEAAREFVEFLLSEEAQEFFRTETSEYPVSSGVEALPELPPLEDLRTIDVPLTELGRDLEGTLDLLKELGLT